MQRIMIIGSGGAGKSVLSRQLQELLQLPLIHLDREYWHPNWVEPSRAEWKQRAQELVQGEQWILDGNYGGTMHIRLQTADTVIWLDLPRWLCIYRVLKRVITYREGRRTDMAPGCPERFDWAFLRYLWLFPKEKRAGIQERLASLSSEKRVVHLQSPREVRKWLRGLREKNA